jgi:hypothetical protein
MLERSFTDSNTHMQSIAKMRAVIANHQVIMQASDEARQKYFDEVYEWNLLEAKNCRLEEEVKHAELRRRMQEHKILRKSLIWKLTQLQSKTTTNMMKKIHDLKVVFLVVCSLFGKQRSCNKTWLNMSLAMNLLVFTIKTVVTS